MRSTNQIDAFDGIFDVHGKTRHDDRRELWRDGRLMCRVGGSVVRSGAIGAWAREFGMVGPWGKYPDRPRTGREADECSAGTTASH
jgi:hypothetical protein